MLRKFPIPEKQVSFLHSVFSDFDALINLCSLEYSLSRAVKSSVIFSRYGVGYRLTLVKERECSVSATSSMVYNHVQDAKLVSDVGAELAFMLPSKSSEGFEPLFRELERK